jgi:homogentisate 1,2-dioxygenase
MPFYHKLGSIPHKRHTQFRKPDGDLFREELMGTRGFSGIQSILYHTYPLAAMAIPRGACCWAIVMSHWV